MASKTITVFSITDESNAGGRSHCWVVKRRKVYMLFGNELGLMAGPCASAVDALQRSGFEFGMANMQFRSSLPPPEFEAAVAGVELSSVPLLFVNGTRVDPTAAGAVAVRLLLQRLPRLLVEPRQVRRAGGVAAGLPCSWWTAAVRPAASGWTIVKTPAAGSDAERS